MVIPGRRSAPSVCLKGIGVSIAAVCCAWMLFVIQWSQLTNVPITTRRISRPTHWAPPLKVFTKVLTMSGGDSEPSSPPWSLPRTVVLTDPDQLDPEINDRYYITSKFFMSPGQGNLMFQYASIFGISWRYNATTVIPEGLLLRRAFRLPGTTVVTNRLSMYLLANWKRRVFPQCCRYYEETEHLANASRFALYGYFQSYKYFHTDDSTLRKAIREQFEFLPEIRLLAQRHLRSALANLRGQLSPTLIGVHVRRGLDMIWNTRNQQHGHTVAPKSYFLRAMSYFRLKFKNAIFVVCSDDHYWVKDNLGHLSDVRIVRSEHREVDMCVLSMCNHTIMSQGTFSWWAAYLAGGETIYYDGWPRKGSQLDQMFLKDDFFLPEWIPMI